MRTDLSENVREESMRPLSVAVPRLDAWWQCAAGFNTAFDQLFGASHAPVCEQTAAETFELIQVCLFFPTLASQYLVAPYKYSLKITDTPHETKGGRFIHLESGANGLTLRLSVCVKFMFDSPLVGFYQVGLLFTCMFFLIVLVVYIYEMRL